MGAGELARAPLISCPYRCLGCFHYKRGSVKNGDAPTDWKSVTTNRKNSPTNRREVSPEISRSLTNDFQKSDQRFPEVSCAISRSLMRDFKKSHERFQKVSPAIFKSLTSDFQKSAQTCFRFVGEKNGSVVSSGQFFKAQMPATRPRG